MRSGKRVTIALAMSVAVVLIAIPVLAGGAMVTSGSVQSFADGPALGYEIDGKASMVRAADGKTIVVVNVSGLAPGVTYGSHVHDQACADGDAGGHYRFDDAVPGGAFDGHEIWPGPFIANQAGRAVGWTAVGATAGETAQSVVVHAPTGQKIACADLS